MRVARRLHLAPERHSQQSVLFRKSPNGDCISWSNTPSPEEDPEAPAADSSAEPYGNSPPSSPPPDCGICISTVDPPPPDSRIAACAGSAADIISFGADFVPVPTVRVLGALADIGGTLYDAAQGDWTGAVLGVSDTLSPFAPTPVSVANAVLSLVYGGSQCLN